MTIAYIVAMDLSTERNPLVFIFIAMHGLIVIFVLTDYLGDL